MVLFGSFGLFATIKDKYRFLYIYMSVMSLVFIIQFITGVVGLSVKNSSKFDDYVANVFAPQLNMNSTQESERDFYQSYFKCCGWNGLSDYILNGQLNATRSCCKNENDCVTSDSSKLFNNACSTKLIDASRHVIQVACAILVTFSVFNIISVVLSFVLARQIKNGYQYTG